MQRGFQGSARLLKQAKDVMEMTEKRFVGVYAKQKVVFSHGIGCHIYDVEGREFLDLSSGVAVNSLGHGDVDWLRALNSQAPKLVHCSNIFYNEPAADLADKLCESSFATHVFFCNSGTEANEGALKFARKYSKIKKQEKSNFLAFHGGFHGRTMGALSATANPKYQAPFLPLIPGFSHIKLNDLPALKGAINENTSAVIVEPIQGEGGINMATKEFLQEVRHLCDKNDSLLIFDEIQCGMGRTGTLWAHEQFGVSPDMMTVAKALGNGYPIGCILVNEKVASALKHGDHGSTFAGQPLACALGLAVLNKINTPEFLGHVNEMGTYFTENLKGLNSPIVKEVRGKGLILGIEIDTQKAGVENISGMLQEAADKGLVVISAGTNVIRIVPPLIISKDQVRKAVDIFGEIFSQYPKKS